MGSDAADSIWKGQAVGEASGKLEVLPEGQLKIISSGKDLWTEKDGAYWVTPAAEAPLPKVASYRCRLDEAGEADVHFFLKAGPCVRESSSAGARTVAICGTSARSPGRTPTVVFLVRDIADGEMTFKAADYTAPNGPWADAEAKAAGMALPGFSCQAPLSLRLDREEDTFKAFVSSSAQESEWVQVGETQLPDFGSAPEAAAGLAVTRGHYTAEGIEGTATFSQISGFHEASP